MYVDEHHNQYHPRFNRAILLENKMNTFVGENNEMGQTGSPVVDLVPNIELGQNDP